MLRPWTALLYLTVLLVAHTSSAGIRDVFKVLPGSYMTNGIGGCDEFIDGLEASLRKIQDVFVQFNNVMRGQAEAGLRDLSPHVRWALLNFWLDPRMRWSNGMSYGRDEYIARMGVLQSYVDELSSLFNGNIANDDRPYLKCNDRWQRWTEYLMNPRTGNPTRQFVNSSNDFDENVWGAYWSDDIKVWGPSPPSANNPAQVDLTHHGAWPMQQRPAGPWDGYCGTAIRPAAAAVIIQKHSLQKDPKLLLLCRETTSDPWVGPYARDVGPADIYGQGHPNIPYPELNWNDPSQFMDTAWLMIHEALHLRSNQMIADQPHSNPNIAFNADGTVNFDQTQWIPDVVNGVRLNCYSTVQCLHLAAERPGPSSQDALHNVNNVVFVLMATYHKNVDISTGAINAPPAYQEQVIQH